MKIKLKASWRIRSAFILIIFLCNLKISFAGHEDGLGKISPAGHREESLQRNPIANEKFPNYFALTSHSPKEMEIALDQALDSIITRLDIPYQKDGKIQTLGFADYLLARVKAVDPGAKVFFSGGVARSLLGYVYQRLYKTKLKNPEMDPFDILISIAAEKNKNPIKSLPAFRALGIGSDMDALVMPSSTEQGDLANRVKRAASEVINSARVHLHLENNNDPLVTSMVPSGDVNFYSEQMSRAIRNGGSTLDYLTFDLQTRKIETPPEYPHIVSQFMQGKYDYVPGTEREDSETTTLRALRPRLEIPSLNLTKSGQNLVQAELSAISSRLEAGGSLSEKALAQFEKMARNARMGGGQNRLFESTDPIDQMAKKIVLKIGTRGKGIYIVPKFIRRDHPTYRINNKIPKELLINPKKFRDTYIRNGKLFHGTPEVNNLLHMIRNGMILSINSPEFNQGAASYGPGAYTTSDYIEAAGYARITHPLELKTGAVIPLELKENVEPNIIDWESVKDTPFIKQVTEYANAQKPPKHVFDVLAQDYGVDIIINTYVLIQNSEILKLPKNLKDLLQFQASALESQFVTASATQESPHQSEGFFSQLEHFRKLYELAQGTGQLNLVSPEEVFIHSIKRLAPEFSQTEEKKENENENGNGNKKKKFKVEMKEKVESKEVTQKDISAEFPELMVKVLDHFDSKYRYGIFFLKYAKPENQFELFNKSLDLMDPQARITAAQYLDGYVDPQTAFMIFKKALQDSNKTVVKNAVNALPKYPGEKAEELYLMAFHQLKEKNIPPDQSPSSDPLMHPQSTELSLTDIGTALAQYPGSETGKMIRKFLQSQDPQIKRGAASGALFYPGPDAFEIFKEMLQKQDPNITQGIREILNPLSENPHTFYMLPTSLRYWYQSSVAATHGDSVFELLFSENDPQLRIAAVNSLFLYGAFNPKFSAEKYDSYLTQALDDPDESVRLSAIKQFYYYKGKNLKKHLEKAINDTKPVVEAFIEFLIFDQRGTIHQIENKNEVIKKLLAHPNQEIVAKVLPFYGGADLMEYITRFLGNPNVYGFRLRSAAASAFGFHFISIKDRKNEDQDENIGQLILQALSDPDDDVRNTIALSISRYRGSHLDAILLKGLEDESYRVRIATADALSVYSLGDSRGKNAEALFTKALLDSNDVVTFNALSSLKLHANHETSGPMLKNLMQSPHRPVKMAAFVALQRYSGPLKDELVEMAIQEGDPELIRGALSALESYQGKKAEELFTKVLSIPNMSEGTRSDVAFCFAYYIEKSENRALLAKMVHHSNPGIREIARLAVKSYERWGNWASDILESISKINGSCEKNTTGEMVQ